MTRQVNRHGQGTRMRMRLGIGAVVSLAVVGGVALAQPAVEYLLPEVETPAPMEANSAGIYGLEHTHVITGDIDKCIEFYVGLLGFTQATPVRFMDSNAAMQEMLGVPDAHFRHALLNMPGGPSFGTHVPQIEIWEITNSAPLDKTLMENPAANLQGKGYNAYRVKDLAAILARLEEAGVKFVSKPIWPSDKQGGIYVVDPDGQLVELDEYETPAGT